MAEDIAFIGELGYESLRGSDSYRFSFDNDWLKNYGSLFFSDDLNNYPGQQYATREGIYSVAFRMPCPSVGTYTVVSSRTAGGNEETRPVSRLSSF